MLRSSRRVAPPLIILWKTRNGLTPRLPSRCKSCPPRLSIDSVQKPSPLFRNKTVNFEKEQLIAANCPRIQRWYNACRALLGPLNFKTLSNSKSLKVIEQKLCRQFLRGKQ